MSSEEKMREEFEAWWESADVWKAAKLEAWIAWKSSRESLVITIDEGSSLSKRMTGFDNYGAPKLVERDSVIESIHAAGVKTK